MPTSAEELAIGQEIEPVVKHMTIERMSRPLMAGGNPIHYDAVFAKNAGLPAPIATGVMSSAFLSEMLTKAFGSDWIRSGSIDVKFIRPIYAGDMLTVRGRVTGKSETSTGVRITLDIWCESQRREPVTVGTASVVVH
jgi:acyl dehydratase